MTSKRKGSQVDMGEVYRDPALAPPSPKLAGLFALINLARQADEKVTDLENQLKDAKEAAKKLWQLDIPDEMFSMQLTKVTTATGDEVLVENVTTAGITEKNRELAYKWLRDHRYESLIKTEITAQPAKDAALRKKVEAALLKTGVSFTTRESVHASTLTAWVKECLEHGVKIPRDLFGVYQFRTAKIKMKKK